MEQAKVVVVCVYVYFAYSLSVLIGAAHSQFRSSVLREVAESSAAEQGHFVC